LNRHTEADGEQVLANAKKVRQHQQLWLPLGGGIGFLLHEYQRHHLVVVVHRDNLPNTLWAVGAAGGSRFGNAAVQDGRGVGVDTEAVSGWAGKGQAREGCGDGDGDS
jgi:hypothetical protein